MLKEVSLILKETNIFMSSSNVINHPQANLNCCPVLLSQAQPHTQWQKLILGNKYVMQIQHRETSHRSIFA